LLRCRQKRIEPGRHADVGRDGARMERVYGYAGAAQAGGEFMGIEAMALT
jgi:hypothetical protein